MSTLISLTGRRFGGLAVTHQAPSRQAPSGSWATYWRAQCWCGEFADYESQNLRRGSIRSCGGPGCRGRYSPQWSETLNEMDMPSSAGNLADSKIP